MRFLHFIFVRLVCSSSRLLPPFPSLFKFCGSFAPFFITACSLYCCMFIAVSHSIVPLLLLFSPICFPHHLRMVHILLGVSLISSSYWSFSLHNMFQNLLPSNGRCPVICSHSVAICLYFSNSRCFVICCLTGDVLFPYFSGIRCFIDLVPRG